PGCRRHAGGGACPRGEESPQLGQSSTAGSEAAARENTARSSIGGCRSGGQRERAVGSLGDRLIGVCQTATVADEKDRSESFGPRRLGIAAARSGRRQRGLEAGARRAHRGSRYRGGAYVSGPLEPREERYRGRGGGEPGGAAHQGG